MKLNILFLAYFFAHFPFIHILLIKIFFSQIFSIYHLHINNDTNYNSLLYFYKVNTSIITDNDDNNIIIKNSDISDKKLFDLTRTDNMDNVNMHDNLLTIMGKLLIRENY